MRRKYAHIASKLDDGIILRQDRAAYNGSSGLWSPARIRENLASLQIVARGTVVAGPVLVGLPKWKAHIVFLDPPYDQEREYEAAMETFGGESAGVDGGAASGAIRAGGIVWEVAADAGSPAGGQCFELVGPEQWFELGFLWMALTGDRPDGWGVFLHEHLTQLKEALGPQLVDTQQRYSEWEQEQRRRAPAQSFGPAAEVRPRLPFAGRRLKRLAMGPLGWILAWALIYWQFVH